MKMMLVSLVLFVSTLASANIYEGRVGVGSPRGAQCRLTILSQREDFYGRANYEMELKKYRVVAENKETVYYRQKFSLQSYGDSLQGSAQTVAMDGTLLKASLVLFFDRRTTAYKAILNENTLNPTSVGRYSVCDEMVLKSSQKR